MFICHLHAVYPSASVLHGSRRSRHVALGGHQIHHERRLRCGKTIPHGEARGELAGTNRMLCDSCRQRQRRLLTRGATLPPRAAACPPDCTGCIMRMKRPAVQRPDSAATAQRAARAPPGARTANHCFLCGTDLPSARYRRLGGTNRMACEACRGWHQWCVSTGKPLPQRVAPCPADSCTGCTFPSARNQQ
jgi:hypothetical protein